MMHTHYSMCFNIFQCKVPKCNSSKDLEKLPTGIFEKYILLIGHKFIYFCIQIKMFACLCVLKPSSRFVEPFPIFFNEILEGYTFLKPIFVKKIG